MHFVDEGTGPVLLLLSAAPLWSFMYRSFLARLRGRFRCVAMDFPGFGPSGTTEEGVDLKAMSTAVTELVEELSLSDVIMVGHDSGGLIATHAAGRMPERLAGVVLANTIGFTIGRFSPVRMMLRLVTSRPAMAGQAKWNWLVRVITTKGVRLRKFAVSERAAYFDAMSDAATRRRPLEVFKAMVDDREFLHEAEAGIARLRHLPVLSVFGRLDPVYLIGYQKKFARAFPWHESVVIPGEAHFVPEGAPGEMISAIESWWSRVGSV